MIPDMLTNDGGFLSSENGYTLRVVYQLATQKHELLYTYMGATNTLFSGTEDECYDKLWQVVYSIDRLTSEDKVPNKITLGPPLPDGFSVIPPEVDADSDERKRKRIKRLKAERDELREKLEIKGEELEATGDELAIVKEHVEVLQAVNNTVNEEKEELQRKYDAMLKEMEGKVEQAEKAAAYVRKLHKEGGDRAEIIGEKVKKAKAELKSEIVKLTKQVEKKDAEIATLETARKFQEDRINAQRTDFDRHRLDFDKDILSKERVIHRLNQKITNLQEDNVGKFNADVEQLQLDVYALKKLTGMIPRDEDEPIEKPVSNEPVEPNEV